MLRNPLVIAALGLTVLPLASIMVILVGAAIVTIAPSLADLLAYPIVIIAVIIGLLSKGN